MANGKLTEFDVYEAAIKANKIMLQRIIRLSQMALKEEKKCVEWAEKTENFYEGGDRYNTRETILRDALIKIAETLRYKQRKICY